MVLFAIAPFSTPGAYRYRQAWASFVGLLIISESMKMGKYLSAAVTLATVAGIATAMAPAFAATPTTTPGAMHVRGDWSANGQMMRGKGGPRGGMMKPGVFGTVSAINGNTITVAGKTGFGSTATSVTYTVDATNATVMKANVAGTLSNIVVGDMIMVQGTVTGTNVVATTIRDGIAKRGDGQGTDNESDKTKTEMPPTFGNGQPIVAGAVTSISGSTITITNKSSATFTIDASSAKFLQGKTTIALSNVAVGDSLVVQGTVNGSAVTASTIMDETRPQQTPSTPSTTPVAKPLPHGMFGGIGSFFKHLFGF